MILILTLCLGILSAAPGCQVVQEKLLSDVTPQQCINKAQEHMATKMWKYREGTVVRKWGCVRHG